MRSFGAYAFLCAMFVSAAAGILAVTGQRLRPLGAELPTGQSIEPVGADTGVGSFPANLVLSSNGKFLLVTDTGFREKLSVLDTTSGKLVSQLSFPDPTGLYFGLACKANGDGSDTVAVSTGSEDAVLLTRLTSEGFLQKGETIKLPPQPNPLGVPLHVAGLAWSSDGTRLRMVANQSHVFNGFHGSVLEWNQLSRSFGKSTPVGPFPLSICTIKDGRSFVANEGGDGVSAIGADGNVQPVQTGEQPSMLCINPSQTRIYVSNSNSDTVSEIDTATLHRVRTISVRPPGLRGYPGVTPLGSAVSPDDQLLFVALADLNAVAVIKIADGKVIGYVPVGWYPTSVAVSGDGQRLFVANAKGAVTRIPNGHDVNGWGQYPPNLLEGTVSMVSIPDVLKRLPGLTEQVRRMNHGFAPHTEPIHNPGIEHVLYIIKENRTYDQVLGDLGVGNGEPNLTLFGQEITPNQHALAKRFGVFDNFSVCAEVSADGWNWSTSGEANEYTQRNVPYNYSGRGRGYDFEGEVNGTPVDLVHQRDVAASAGGYVWDSVLAKGLSVRNYGFFVGFGSKVKGPDGQALDHENSADKRALAGCTCEDFRRFDLRFPDSDAWVKFGLTPAPNQLKSYGTHQEPSRFTTWLREFRGYVKNGDLPNLSMLRLPRDHTSGTSEGMSSARAMAADNDYAVGEVVDAVSHSPYWKSTVIFVVEDDAQDGFDHVDCHRSNMLVISPWLKRGRVDSTFYNTDSVLATIEGLLKARPANQYVATARRFDVFGEGAENREPYDAIPPGLAILGEVNGASAYRSADSKRLLSMSHEESEPDMELNEILWHSIKGRRVPLPHTPGALSGR